MFEKAFKQLDDALRKGAGELDYVEQRSWLLKHLDGMEEDRSAEARLQGKTPSPVLDEPYRWETWAAPPRLQGVVSPGGALAREWAQSL